MIIKFVDQSEFLWMTTQETSACPQCTGRGAALPVVAASGKPIMAFNWDFNCVWWSKSIDYKTGGIWVHACLFCVSIRVAYQILFLSWPVNGSSWNQTASNHIRHAIHDMSIIWSTGEDGNSVSQAHWGRAHTGICADTKMLLVWGILQKLPFKWLYIHSLHSCPLDMSSRSSFEINGKHFAY